MFSLSSSVFNVSRLSKSTPPVVITCNQGVFKSPVQVLLKTNDGKTLTECKAQVVAPKKASFRLPVDDLLKMKPSTINVHVAIGDSPLRDTNLSMEFKEDDSVFKEAEAPRSRFPKQFNGQLLHLDLAETTVQFSVPSQVYDSCMQFTGPFYIKDKYIIGANEEQRNDIKHWIFNPSHNRSSKAKLDYSTSENKSSYTQVVVVRSGAQFEQYQQVWGSSHIIMVLPLYFGTSSDNNGIGYTRKVIMAVADKLNLKRIWLIDDNVHSFYKLNTKTVQHDRCDITEVLKGIEDIFSCAQTTNEKYSSSTCLAELPKGSYFDVYNDGPFSQNAVISQNAMKARLEKIMDPVSSSDLFIGSPNNYGVVGIARLGQFQHIYKKPFVRDQVYSCLLINLEAIRQRNKVLEKSNLPLITYPEYPIFEDMKFNDICDFNGLWVVKSNRFLHKKVQTKEIKGTQKLEWRKQFVSSFDLYGKINGHISRLPFKTLNVRKFATINDLKYMIERHPDIGTKKYGKILQLNSIAEHDTSLSLGHSLKDYNIVAKIFHTDDKELDDKIHKLHIEFEKAAFDIIPTKQLYFDIKYGPPETAQVFYPIAAIVVHGSADSNVQVELRVVEKIPVKRMIMPLSGKSRTATFKNITFDKAGHYKFIAVALQDPPMSVEADHMTHVIDLTAQRSSDYFQQGLRLSVKLEECDMEVKKKYHHEHEFYEKTWPAHRARFVNTQGFHLRICQYLAYVCYLSHLHKTKSTMSAVIKLPTGAGKTVLGCLLPFLAAKNKVLILTTSPLISSEFKKALMGSRKRKEISMFERYALLHPSAFPSVAIFKEKDSLKEVTKICTQANYIVCNYQKLTQGKVVRENGYLQMLSKLHIDMIIVDEAHHDAADSYQAIYNYFPGAKKILLTATPFRTDQKTLGGTDGARPIFNYSIQDALKAKIIKDISHVTVRAQNMTISGSRSVSNTTSGTKKKKLFCVKCHKPVKKEDRIEYDDSDDVLCSDCNTEQLNFGVHVTKKKQPVSTSVNESNLIHNYYPQKQFSMAILGQKNPDKKACFIDPEAISPSVEILLKESLLKLQEKRASSASRLHHKIIVYCDSIKDTITVTKFYNEVALKLFKEKKLHSILRAAAFHSNPDSESKDRIEQHQIDVVVQSKMLGEGYDHKEFTIAVLVGSKIKSLSKYIQFVGRIMRRLVNGDKQDNQAVIFVQDGLQFEKLWQAYKGEDVEVSFETLSKTDTQYKITKEEHYMTFESLAQTSSQSSSAHK